MASLPSGCSVAFYYRADKNGAFIKAKVADGSDEFTTVGARKAQFNIGCEGQIFEPRLVLTPSINNTPEIYKISIYFN